MLKRERENKKKLYSINLDKSAKDSLSRHCPSYNLSVSFLFNEFANRMAKIMASSNGGKVVFEVSGLGASVKTIDAEEEFISVKGGDGSVRGGVE